MEDATNPLFELTGNTLRGPAVISFSNSASAGDFTFYDLHSAQLFFSADATAEGATIDVNGSSLVTFTDNARAGASYLNILPATAAGAEPGRASLMGNSTGDVAALSASGASRNHYLGGTISFLEDATAGNAGVSAHGGTGKGAGAASVSFLGNSSAGNALMLADAGSRGGDSGVFYFSENSSGDSAYLTLLGSSSLDLSGHASPGVGLGSVDGSGNIYLGSNNLTIGSTNYSRTLSGAIQDGGVAGGSGGSLTKVGSGTLTLTGKSTYTGGTLVEDGFLFVANKRDSATGSGSVQVESTGWLVGTGTIGGSVTIGVPNGGGVISPGPIDDEIGKLTILGSLTFEEGSSYYYGLNVDKAKAATIVAKGADVTHCGFGFVISGTHPLPVGTVFKIIDNTSASPIIGTFPGYPVGGTLGLPNGNQVQINYDGGDGNDVTLTVVS